jgi:hypothetical protein
MIALVRKNDVILRNERRKQAEIRGVAGAEKKRRLRTGKSCEFILKVAPRFPLPCEQARACTADFFGVAYPFGNFCAQSRMFRESQIIVGAEIDTANFGQAAALAAGFESVQPLVQTSFPRG